MIFVLQRALVMIPGQLAKDTLPRCSSSNNNIPQKRHLSRPYHCKAMCMVWYMVYTIAVGHF